ncbi:MAG: hypothetical protein J6334_02550, partial [Kiritimatiellae bacterium]|nr:hypothetical protein [Kiritimatiellia bacterium]
MKDIIIRLIAKLTGGGFKEAEAKMDSLHKRAKSVVKGIGGLAGKAGEAFFRGGVLELGAQAAMYGINKYRAALEQAKRAEEELIAATERWNRKLA